MCKSSCPARPSSSRARAARCPRRSRTSSTSCLLNRKSIKKISIPHLLGVEPLTVLASGVGGRRAIFRLNLPDTTTASYRIHKAWKRILTYLDFPNHTNPTSTIQISNKRTTFQKHHEQRRQREHCRRPLRPRREPLGDCRPRKASWNNWARPRPSAASDDGKGGRVKPILRRTGIG